MLWTLRSAFGSLSSLCFGCHLPLPLRVPLPWCPSGNRHVWQKFLDVSYRPKPQGAQSTKLSCATRANSFVFSVASESPTLTHWAAMSKSCAPISSPRSSRFAQRWACTRAASRSNGTVGKRRNKPSTNRLRASRRLPAGARSQPCSSSDAVTAAIRTVEVACASFNRLSRTFRAGQILGRWPWAQSLLSMHATGTPAMR